MKGETRELDLYGKLEVPSEDLFPGTTEIRKAIDETMEEIITIRPEMWERAQAEFNERSV